VWRVLCFVGGGVLLYWAGVIYSMKMYFSVFFWRAEKKILFYKGGGGRFFGAGYVDFIIIIQKFGIMFIGLG
jgi:hypothetical protein